MLRRTGLSLRISGHSMLTCTIGTESLQVGTEVFPLLPANHLFHDPPKLRALLDREGYLYFKNIIDKKQILAASDDLAEQMMDNEWLRPQDMEREVEHNGFCDGFPYPVPCLPTSFKDGEGKELPVPTKGFGVSKPVHDVTNGVAVMSLLRQILSGPVKALPRTTFEFSQPHELHNFHMDHRFASKGSPLTLTAWIPLQNITLQMGGLVVVRGSNGTPQFQKIRETYGQEDVENGTIHGDGGYTMDPKEIIDISKVPTEKLFDMNSDAFNERIRVRGGTISQARVGKIMEGNKDPNEEDDDLDILQALQSPLVTTGYEMGDVVITTGYTMHSFVTNRSRQWRMSAESKWIMADDNIGSDPRFATATSPGLAKWNEHKNNKAVYPRSMEQAKKEWGLIPDTAANGNDAKK